MKNYLKNIGAVILIFISSTLVPFATFKIFSFSFTLEPENFWRFTPATPLHSIPANWIIATLVANIIIAFFAVLGYYIFNKAIKGSWIKKATVFGTFSIILGVYIPLWSFYTLSNISSVTTLCLMLDGTFEYFLYTFLIAFVLRDKFKVN